MSPPPVKGGGNVWAPPSECPNIVWFDLVVNEARLAQALKNLLDKGKGHLHDPTAHRKFSLEILIGERRR
jgi:hypothetical protein